MFSEQDTYYMQQALKLAKQAELELEVPVGALIVHESEVVGQGFNQPISTHDPSAHAEMQAVRQACEHFANYRLPKGCTLYVTLEPCMMCLGLLSHARLSKLIYAAKEPRTGAICSAYNYLEHGYYNHKIEVQGGLLADQSAELLRSFFKQRRGAKPG